jgi:hypothetical protein
LLPVSSRSLAFSAHDNCSSLAHITATPTI